MKSFKVNLTKEIKDEIFSDLNNDFTLLLLMEAIMNTNTMDKEEDLEVKFEESTQDLLEVMRGESKDDDGEEDNDEELTEIITEKLTLAINCIQDNNSVDSLVLIKGEFKELDKKGGVAHSATHLENGVVFCIGEVEKEGK